MADRNLTAALTIGAQVQGMAAVNQLVGTMRSLGSMARQAALGAGVVHEGRKALDLAIDMQAAIARAGTAMSETGRSRWPISTKFSEKRTS